MTSQQHFLGVPTCLYAAWKTATGWFGLGNAQHRSGAIVPGLLQHNSIQRNDNQWKAANHSTTLRQREGCTFHNATLILPVSITPMTGTIGICAIKPDDNDAVGIAVHGCTHCQTACLELS